MTTLRITWSTAWMKFWYRVHRYARNRGDYHHALKSRALLKFVNHNRTLKNV